MKIKIKVKNAADSYSHIEKVNDEFHFSRENPELEALINRAKESSEFQVITSVQAIATMDWQ